MEWNPFPMISLVLEIRRNASGRIFLNKIPEFDGLDPIKRCKDDILILAGECALGKNNGGASVQVILDKVADRLGTCAHYVEILG